MMSAGIGRRIEHEFVAIDIAPSGSRETQSGLNLIRPRVYGVLAKPAKPGKTACIVMHPVSNFMAHYLLDPMADRGIACLGLNSRYINNDTMLIVERVIKDLGAGVRFLRERGFERVVLLGNSGGAALVALYQSQAENFTLTTLADGSPSGLSPEDFPVADAIALFGAHEGRPLLFEKWIDPAVLDEQDPLTVDSSIDMFNPTNGPAYSGAFIELYRKRQTERRDRIERWVEARLARLATDPTGPQDEAFIVHRTLADPRCLDLSLDRNDRPVGTIWGEAREVNSSANSVGRFTSLRAFLSQWSSKSRMDGPYWLARTRVPALHFTFTADASTFPSTRDLWMQAGADRIANIDVPKGNHYLRDQPKLVTMVADALEAWMATDFKNRPRGHSRASQQLGPGLALASENCR